MRIDTDVYTNKGRIDAVIELPEQVFLFEFKLDKSAAEALQQIKQQAYIQRYRRIGKPLILVGANFDSAQRQISEWQEETNPASAAQTE